MPVQAHPTRRKARWSTSPPRPSAGTHAQPYRRRRPETTSLHRIVREHLETYLALANESDLVGDGVPDHVLATVPGELDVQKVRMYGLTR